MRNKRDYFDIELDEKDLIGSNLEAIFYLKDLKQRKLFLETDVEQLTVSDIVKNILQYNKEDIEIPVEERAPIKLYIASNGGEVDAGFELIDAIQLSKTPVYTINMGCAYSMGFLIALAGHKRFAMPTAKFLMHDGSNFVYNSGSKAQDQMAFNARVEERIKNYILSHTKLTEEEYNSKLRVEYYSFADEAKEKGFVDYIIGADCDIDEVI